MENVMIYYFAILIFACGCSNPSRSSDVKLPISDTFQIFVRDIPEYPDGSLYDGEVWNLASQLKLDKLDTGFNDIQIRIWLGHSMAVNKNILIFKKVADSWYGQLVTFTESDADGRKSQPTVVKFQADLFPKSGWPTFLTQLNQMKIFDSLDKADVSIQKGCGGADGMSYDFELATPTKYRLHHHCEPTENFRMFTLYLEKEFEFEYMKD